MTIFRFIIMMAFLTINIAVIESAGAEALVHFNSAGTPPTAFQIKRAKAKGIEAKARPGVEIAGTLRLPASDTQSPALVLLHSCRGVLPYLQDWAVLLTTEGFVTLVVDGYSPRGITDECAVDIAGYGGVNQSSDAYGALQYLATLDAVDGDRIGLLGWGQAPVIGVMVLGGFERFFKQKFRAAIGFYISCYSFTEGMVYAPTQFLIAGKNDWTKPGRCSKSVEAGQRNGSPISMVIYPGALHGFDDPGTGGEIRLELPNQYKNPPIGVTLGYNGDAHAAAKDQVKLFLRQNLSAK
jgi:dienelactone hydrolase